MFLNKISDLYESEYKCFRPLSGSYVSQSRSSVSSSSWSGFRPLSGSYVSQLGKSPIYTVEDPDRFRPLSGSYVSQYSCRRLCLRKQLSVSVPCRGAMFLNYYGGIYKSVSEGFRPLSGSYVSQFSQVACNIRFCLPSCFRPLSGSYVSQSEKLLDEAIRKYRFRPLSGSYVSQ